MDLSPAALLAQAHQRYHDGDLSGAEGLGRGLLQALPLQAAHLLGVIALGQSRFDEAIAYLQSALLLSSDNLEIRISLALALANSGRLDEARTVAGASASARLQRIVAFVDQKQGKIEPAIAAYRRVLLEVPDDHQSWANLGRLLMVRGDLGEAVEAFERSLALRAEPATYVGLSRALASGAHFDRRHGIMRLAVKRFPDDADLHVERGLAAVSVEAFDEAETAFGTARRIAPNNRAALLEEGMLLLRLNRLESLQALVDEAEATSITGPELDLLKGWLLARAGRFQEASSMAERLDDRIGVLRRDEFTGEVADRLGESDRAFAAFTSMNAVLAQGPAAAFARSLDFPAQIARETAQVTPEWVRRWPAVLAPSLPPAPIFIVGFPRSGTTLLDTLLMNVAELLVLEEPPMMARVEAELGGIDALADLTESRLSDLRALYFEELRRHAGDVRERTVVDKFPLNLVRVPLIYRLFPDARIIFVERHPCDAVLSCFMSRFQVNRANIHFNTLADAARLYDVALSAWTNAEALLPIRTHRMRYERMVGDLRGEMRALLDFVELPWRDDVLDNRGRAARRGHIPTPSYAQVSEPIYARAVGRWRRYRSHMAAVLPVLGPWVRRLGYDMEEHALGKIGG